MPDPRAALRQRLIQARKAWAATDAAAHAQHRLERQVLEVLQALEPDRLGVYWPLAGEFNPRDMALAFQQACGGPATLSLALPWAQRAEGEQPAFMAYRDWDGQTPTQRDGHGIPCPDSRTVSPDVLIVPCVGFNAQGYRLGYGGGYFDRYLAAHPHVTALGVAWDEAQLTEADGFVPQAHDRPLMAVVTPSRVYGG